METKSISHQLKHGGIHHEEHQEDIFARAVYLNNAAACYIENGDYGTAISNLNRILTDIKNLLRTHNSSPNTVAQSCFQFGEWMRLPYAIGEGEEPNANKLCTKTPRALHQNSEEEDYIYRHPIYIPDQAFKSINLTGEQDCLAVLLTVISLFNVALAHQLLAMESRSNRRFCLQKSSRLYELGYHLAATNKIDGGSLFLLSILNNLGHVYKTLSCHIKASKCFQQLLSTLMYLSEGCKCDDLAALSGFFGSTCYLYIQDFCAAAA